MRWVWRADWSALLLAGTTAWATAATAQEASDLNPPAATQGAGGAWAPGWYPGMPVPQPQTPQTQAATTAAAKSGAGAGASSAGNAGRGEAIYTAADLSGGPWERSHEGHGERQSDRFIDGPYDGPTDGNGIPESHRVQKGDTLWGLSSTYYRTPWFWPKLWSYNPLITNPHWIYPGDVVRLRPMSGPMPAMPKPATGPSAGPELQSTRSLVSNIGLRQTGFVEQGELKNAAEIVGSREEKTMLATLDEAYLKYPRSQPLIEGQRYSIYRVVSDVKRPGTRDLIGHIVEVVGEVEVRSITDKHIAKVVITDATNPIERHFRVGPLRRRFAMVDPVAATANVDAFVAATLRPSELLGEAMLVFVDRGQDDGLAVGNRLAVVRRGDGSVALLTRKLVDDDRYPREVVGELLVIEVRGKTSTAVVWRSVKEISVGDRVQARKGF